MTNKNIKKQKALESIVLNNRLKVENLIEDIATVKGQPSSRFNKEQAKAFAQTLVNERFSLNLFPYDGVGFDIPRTRLIAYLILSQYLVKCISGYLLSGVSRHPIGYLKLIVSGARARCLLIKRELTYFEKLLLGAATGAYGLMRKQHKISKNEFIAEAPNHTQFKLDSLVVFEED